MDKNAADLKIIGSTMNPATQPTAQQQSVNLGGFAYSFEELLQRVGARLEHAFSAADTSSGILQASNDTAPREASPDRDSSGDTSASRDDNGSEVAHRDTDTGTRADQTHREDDPQSSATRSDNPSGDETRNSSGQNEDGRNKENASSGNEGEQSASDDNSGGTDKGDTQSSNQETQNGSGDESAVASNASGDPAAQSVASGQAAAMYAAGIVGKNNNGQTVNANEGDSHQSATNADKSAQNTAAQLGSLAAQSNAAKAKKSNHQGPNQQSAENSGPSTKAENVVVTNKSDAIQSQARKLSQAIGSENRATVNVSVTNEQSTLSSRPTATVANASILTKDGAQTAQNGQQNQANTQNQGNNGQTNAQMQAAAMQQAQAAQQAAQQAAVGGASAGSGASGAGTLSGPSTVSGGQHGLGDGMNNTLQNTSAGQQTQQSQQTRETQPQQQAQQAQRAATQGASITDQISVKITKALQAGTDRINIQLKPAELGRVDVRMEMTQDGRVMTVVTADRQETLDLLRRDSSELQRALQDAGFQTGDMDFNLKGQEQQTADNETANGGDGSTGEKDGDAAEAAEDGDGVMSAWESGIFMDGRVDMRA